MAIVPILSGTAIGKSLQVNVDILGGIRLDDSTGRYDGLPSKSNPNAAESRQYLSASFDGSANTVIQALNYLHANATAAGAAGPTGSIQLKGTSGFNSYSGFKLDSNGTLHVPVELNVTGAVDMASSLVVDGITTLGATTGATISALGLLTVNNATDASSKTAAGAIFDGGIAVAKKAHIGTGATIDAGGLTVTAGGVEVTADGLEVTAGGATITAGGLTVSAGTSAVKALTATTISGSSTLKIAGASELGAETSCNIGADGVVSLENATDASSKTTGALKVAGGLSAQLKGHFGTGLTVDSGGLTVTAGNATLGGNLYITGAMGALDKFGDLPVFTIQGTDSNGTFQDYHIAVSGGIMRAILV